MLVNKKTLGKTHFYKLNKKSNIIFTCEHASPRIPKFFKNLGLKKDELKNSKDLFDPGAKKVFDLFVNKYKTSNIYSNISRLIIDSNRHLKSNSQNNNSYHAALVKKQLLIEKNKTEKILNIPFNTDKDFKYVENLYTKVCIPYQNDLKKMICELEKLHKKIFIISIHTMFPYYNGPFRKEEIDLIGDESNLNFKKVVSEFKDERTLNVGINKPWGFKDVDYGVFYEIIKFKNVNVMAFEIRNDLVKTDKQIMDIFKKINEKIIKFTE